MALGKRIDISTAAHTDVGRVRKANEDSYYISRDENLLIVCDGMGGQVAGGLASKIAVETIKDVYYGIDENIFKPGNSDLDQSLSRTAIRLVTAVRMANRRLYKIAVKFPKLRGMGTTVVALTFDKSFATMVHVGDSRIFRISGDKVLQLTEDHSWLNELIEDEEINEEQIETFQQKNVITRALGTGPTVKVDIHSEKYEKDDVYVMCTDGLHTSVSGKDIKKMYDRDRASLDLVARKIVEKAKKRDGTDNITVAVATVNQKGKSSKKAGVSITVPEETEKVRIREDKLIHEHYGDPKLKPKNTSMNNKLSNKILVPGLVTLIGLCCFAFGLKLSSSGTKPGPKKFVNSSVKPNIPNAKTPAKQPPETRLVSARAGDSGKKAVRSALGKDAVLAFVFFNNEQDYRASELGDRAEILEILHPYSEAEEVELDGPFSIFLIDESHNVIFKSSEVTLPDLGE